MFIDSSLQLADGAAIPTLNDSAAQVFGEIDLRGPAGISDNSTVDLSAGEPLYLVIEVDTAITGGGTSSFEVRTHTAPGVTGDMQGSIVFKTGLSADNQAAGSRWIVQLPEAAYRRYLYVGHQNNNTNAPTGGTASAFITKDVSNWTSTNTRVNV